MKQRSVLANYETTFGVSQFRLTQFSPGSGCGCKIAPKELEAILQCDNAPMRFTNLLVGSESHDDAAVFDIGNGQAVVSTTDFFTPIVDSAYDFGRIAATNAISDVYAMGGNPLMAIAILGWPLDKLPAGLAREVVAGAREVCASVKIPLAGGHSINIATPIFGLAVTGLVLSGQVKKNCTARTGNRVFLTKPLGIGLVTTAEKCGVVKPDDATEVVRLMTTLNVAGCDFAQLNGVRAMTDVTGFGLLGHTIEMAEGSGLQMVLEYSKLPRIAGVDSYIAQDCIPGGTTRNWNSYGHKVLIDVVNKDIERIRALVCDPQTSGGLLVAVEPEAVENLQKAAQKTGTPLYEIGYLADPPKDETWIQIV
jgi:selenide,water dikinase